MVSSLILSNIAFPRISISSRVVVDLSKLTNLASFAVPGSSQRFLDKSRSLVADCVTYDLEDSVTPHMKAEARGLVRRAIDQPTPANIRERAVRINSVDSGLALGDLTEVVSTDIRPQIPRREEREMHMLT